MGTPLGWGVPIFLKGVLMIIGHILKKVNNILIALVISVCLMISSMQVPKVYATGIVEAYTAWEVIQAILLSMGITVTAGELLPDDFKEAAKDAVVKSWNDFTTGLGDAVNTAVNSVKLGTATTLTLAADTWDKLKNWARSKFTESSDFSLDLDVGVSVTFSSLYGIADILNPYQQGYPILATYSDTNITNLIGQKANENYNRYLTTYTDANYRTVSIIRFIKRVGRNTTSVDSIFFIAAPTSDSGRISITQNDNGRFVISLASGNQFYLLQAQKLDSILSLADTYDCYWAMPTNVSALYESYTIGSSTPVEGYDYQFESVMIGSKVSTGAKLKARAGVRSIARDPLADIVTPTTDYVNGILGGNITITLPTDLTDVINGLRSDVIDLSDAIAKLKVIPVDTTDTAEIEQAIAAVKQPAGEIDQFQLSLADFFPFCLPFDFVDFLKVLQAEPQAPSITFKFPVGYGRAGVTWEEYEIDLSVFDDVAYWVRRMELLVFIVSLILATRSMFIRS